MSNPSLNTPPTSNHPPNNAQLPQSAARDPYGDMQQLSAQWASLSLNNSPASTPSPPKRRVYKPRSTPKKQPGDMYKLVDLKGIEPVLTVSLHLRL